MTDQAGAARERRLSPADAGREALLAQRAQRLALRPGPSSAPGAGLAVLTCSVGEGLHVLPLTLVHGVTPSHRLGAAPAGGAVAGVIATPEGVLPVLDLEAALSARQAGKATGGYLIRLRAPWKVALWVSQEPKLSSLGAQQEPGSADLILTGEHAGRLASRLDLEALLSRPDAAAGG